MAVLASRPSWATSWSLLALSCFCPGHCRNADSRTTGQWGPAGGLVVSFPGALMRPWLACGGGGLGPHPFPLAQTRCAADAWPYMCPAGQLCCQAPFWILLYDATFRAWGQKVAKARLGGASGL